MKLKGKDKKKEVRESIAERGKRIHLHTFSQRNMKRRMLPIN